MPLKIRVPLKISENAFCSIQVERINNICILINEQFNSKAIKHTLAQLNDSNYSGTALSCMTSSFWLMLAKFRDLSE